MKSRAIILGLIFAAFWGRYAIAAPETYTLKVTQAQLDIIANALSERPYREVAPVIIEISKQIQEQSTQPHLPRKAPPCPDGTSCSP
jgi:hypothetical protein